VSLETENLWSYPSASQLNFGTDYAGSDFVIPVVRFQFADTLGDDLTNAPIIFGAYFYVVNSSAKMWSFFWSGYVNIGITYNRSNYVPKLNPIKFYMVEMIFFML
jgi:hypothetical protein